MYLFTYMSCIRVQMPCVVFYIIKGLVVYSNDSYPDTVSPQTYRGLPQFTAPAQSGKR